MKRIDTLSYELALKDFLEVIDYRVTRTREELEKAFSLVYREYLKRGYAKENTYGLRTSVYNALPQTTTFIALAGEDVIATATLIPDSPLGLPMDEAYQAELNRFREGKKKLCEISMLASNTELFKTGISMMLHSKKLFFILFLFKLIFDYAKDYLKLDFICICINPKHRLIYDFLLFKDLGDLKTYHNANGAPAIAKHLDLNSVEEECKRKNEEGLYRMFFLRETDPVKFSQKIMFTFQDLKYFFVEKADIFKTASPAQIEYIKRCYPTYDFSKIID